MDVDEPGMMDMAGWPPPNEEWYSSQDIGQCRHAAAPAAIGFGIPVFWRHDTAGVSDVGHQTTAIWRPRMPNSVVKKTTAMTTDGWFENQPLSFLIFSSVVARYFPACSFASYYRFWNSSILLTRILLVFAGLSGWDSAWAYWCRHPSSHPTVHRAIACPCPRQCLVQKHTIVPSTTRGAVDMFSVPPAKTTCCSPSLIPCTAWMTVSNPLPHKRLIVSVGVLIFIPLVSATWRATYAVSHRQKRWHR